MFSDNVRLFFFILKFTLETLVILKKKSKSLSSIIQRNRHSLDVDRKEDPKINLTARKNSIYIIPLGPHQSGTTRNFSSTKKTKSVIVQ